LKASLLTSRLAVGRPYTTAEAFSQLFDRQNRVVFRYIYGIGGGAPQDIEDLTAETFLRAWKARHRFQGDEEAALGWLLHIARNLVIDSYRRRKVDTDEHIDAADTIAADNGPEDDLLAREQWNRVWDLTQSLPAHQREMLVLRYLVGWRINRIAEHLGVPENTVSVTLRRVIDRLAGEKHDETA
jgi:RNA polymerase sigma-70 factor (ECF subfamily)